MQINDRVFVVTGATQGIGLATAEMLTARGAQVALIAAAPTHSRISPPGCPAVWRCPPTSPTLRR